MSIKSNSICRRQHKAWCVHSTCYWSDCVYQKKTTYFNTNNYILYIYNYILYTNNSPALCLGLTSFEALNSLKLCELWLCPTAELELYSLSYFASIWKILYETGEKWGGLVLNKIMKKPTHEVYCLSIVSVPSVEGCHMPECGTIGGSGISSAHRYKFKHNM